MAANDFAIPASRSHLPHRPQGAAHAAPRPEPLVRPRHARFRPRLEVLEGRCTPTVTTSFSAGALTITGSALDNHVAVAESATHGSYTVGATDGVSGATTFSGVQSIAIDLQGQALGGDTVEFFGDAAPNAFLSGALSITGAGGLKVGFRDNFNVSGTVTLTKTTNTGAFFVKTGATDSDAAEQTNVSLGPTTITNNGTGGTTVLLQGFDTNDVAVRGALSVKTGAGSNEFLLFNVTVTGGLTVSDAHAGVDFIILGGDTLFGNGTSVNIGGFVSLNGTNAASGLNVSLDRTTIGTFFSVASGNGNDSVTVDRTSVLGLGLLPQQQTFGVDLKGGTNTSNLGTAGPSAANVVHGSLFHFGAGAETFNLENYLISSFVTVNAQAGNTGVNARITDSNISNFLSFAAAGTGNDNITVNNLSIGQNFALGLGGGNNISTITNNHYLGSYAEIDTGTDAITFTGNTGFGDVTFSANRLIINGGSFQNDQIAGNASFTSAGSTNDDVNLGPSLGAVADDSNDVAIGKALSMNVGSSAGLFDTVTINNVTVKTDLTLTAAANNAETFVITNAKLGGDLSVNAGASTASLTVLLRTLGSVGDLTVTTGSLDDTVELTDVAVGGTTTITTNAGTDQVNLESSAITRPGPSQFFGAVTVSTGGGGDTINLGNSLAGNEARFYAAVTFDGGAGTDTLTETAPQYFGGAPTKTNIP
jgi:hypothetical protein